MSLSWDWNPVIFFIVLAVSIALALTLKKRQVAWVLPALVLYFGLDWEFSSTWSQLFKLVFWLAVIVALVTAFLPGKSKFAKAPLAILSVVTVLMLIGSGLNGWLNDGSQTSSLTTAVLPKATGTPTGTPCPEGYVQKFNTNKAQRLFDNGVKTSDKDLEYLGHDARTLAARAFALKFVTTPDASKLLEPGKKCLSREGQDLYLQVKGALTGKGVKVDNNGTAPADGYNTGMDNGKFVVDSSQGVRGNRSAIVYTLRDGSKLYVMHRCGNLVFMSPPKGVPHGHTDNPKCKHHCTPPCVEIPGNGVADCSHKDPSLDPNPNNNAPQGGGGNKVPGSGALKPQPTFRPDPRPSPTQPAPTTVPRTEPTQPPQGGDGSGNNDNSGDGGPP